jgi:3-deoxy-manno-octulosonate cytidylyltransferase (CMP-KDO synthetase)
VNIIGIIPARMASTRFPGKPLARINGIPMIGHVYHRSKMCSSLNEVHIATCDDEIRSYAESIGASCIMTAETHTRASDRAAEATRKIEETTGRAVDIVMLIQGDEPMLQPEMLQQAIAPLVAEPTLAIANLMAVTTEADFGNPNVVKVVTDLNGNALYFSREPIPSLKMTASPVPGLKQLGLIAFRRDYLLKYIALTPTPLEAVESVDMLRVLEHGDQIRMVLTENSSVGVDTPEDLARVEGLMAAALSLSEYQRAGG